MSTIPCYKRTFYYQINIATYYPIYLRWFRYLSERLGLPYTLELWRNTFITYDDSAMLHILKSGWDIIEEERSEPVSKRLRDMITKMIPATNFGISADEIRNLIDNTPPIRQIWDLFLDKTIGRDISAYDALHLRFDGLACLAEALIDRFGTQGELIVYDLDLEERLAQGGGKQGSVEEYLAMYMAEPEFPNLFTAGLEYEIIKRTKRELILDVVECEWARYFQERHPTVGYLMACSTDEISCRSFHKDLRLQRTQTLMEGGKKCDFRIFSVEAG